MQLPGVIDELAVPVGQVARRREAAQFVAHRVFGFAQVEHLSAVEEAAPLRVESAQVEPVVHVDAGLVEDTAEDFGHGEDGRAHVEAIACSWSTAALPPSQGFLSARVTR